MEHTQLELPPCMSQDGYNAVKGGGVTYGEYLKLDSLLDCQVPLSHQAGNPVDDEHLFIVTHQVYELWFKQILFDIDHLMRLFTDPILNESSTLKIVSKLERIVKIMKVLVDQILILETMTPLDFMEFRKYLAPASGFQSYQFRMLENKLGVRPACRVLYNAQNYIEAFKGDEEQRKLSVSEANPSLAELVERWLRRTPGVEARHGFHFWPLYCASVNRFLADYESEVNAAEDAVKAEQSRIEYSKIKAAFKSVLDEDLHNEMMKRGDRRFSHQAMQGALLISFYRDQPRFSQPYQVLSLLMDVDSLLTKWRYNHVMLVQRMLGSKQGTGGSSGYLYLRSTCGDRYKVFLDLFNLSTWLLPRAYVPSLPPDIVRMLGYPPDTVSPSPSTGSSSELSSESSLMSA